MEMSLFLIEKSLTLAEADQCKSVVMVAFSTTFMLTAKSTPGGQEIYRYRLSCFSEAVSNLWHL